MKKYVLFILILFFGIKLFALISPQDDNLQFVMEAKLEGCSISIEKSQTVTTKYGKMKTADNTYIAYYPSGKIKLLFLKEPAKIKIQKQNFIINSFLANQSNDILKKVDIPVEFYENGNLKSFICESSQTISKLNVSTKESTLIKLDENENIIYFVPKKIPGKELTLKNNNIDFSLDYMGHKPVELYSSGNLKTIVIYKKTTDFGKYSLDYSKSHNNTSMVVNFYESGEIESLGITRNSLGHESTFSVLLNDDWYDVSSISFFESGICKTMDFNPRQEIEVLWNGSNKKFLQKNIVYKPNGDISVIVGAFNYYNTNNELDFFYQNKCYLIYKNSTLSKVLQPESEERYLQFIYFDDENNPVAYGIGNNDIFDYIELEK